MNRHSMPLPATFLRGFSSMNMRWQLLLFALVLTWILAPAPGSAEDSFFAYLKNASGDGVTEQCLDIDVDGETTHPVLRNSTDCQGTGYVYPMYAGTKLWKFVSLGEDLYLIMNSNRGHDECLVMGDFGLDAHPSRFSWGTGNYCGFPGGKDQIRHYSPAVWHLTRLEGERYMITNSSLSGAEKCLIMGNGGQGPYPERWTWGLGDFCGFPGGKSALLANKQAVWTLRRLAFDRHEVPQSWLDGYVLLESDRRSNLRLGSDGESYPLRARWGDDASYRWRIEPSSSDNYFYLRNGLYDQQRLHVGHDGNGELYAEWGDDDAYQWSFLSFGDRVSFFNKKFPHQQIVVPNCANGKPFAGDWSTDQPFWRVHPVSDLQDSAPAFQLDTYSAESVLLNSRRFAHQFLKTSNIQGDLGVDAGSDFLGGYLWSIEPSVEGFSFVLNGNAPSSDRLHVGHNGNGQVYVEPGDDWAFGWYLEPVIDSQAFRFRSALYSDQFLRLRDDGSGEASAGPSLGQAAEWRIIWEGAQCDF